MCRLLMIAFLAATIGWYESTTAVGQDKSGDREGLARVKHLIEMLVSKNAAPVVQGDSRQGDDEMVEFSTAYDKSLQVPVYLAVQQLLVEGETAIGPLLAHAADQRYSFSINFSNTDYNVSVSSACGKIVNRIVLPFEPKLHLISRSQFVEYPQLEQGDKSWTKWWAKNNHRGLPALQIEAIDAAIAKMQSLNGETASTIHPDAERLPLIEFNRLREDNLRILKSIRRTIVGSKEAYRANSLDDSTHYMFGLPWTGRKHNK